MKCKIASVSNFLLMGHKPFQLKIFILGLFSLQFVKLLQKSTHQFLFHILFCLSSFPDLNFWLAEALKENIAKWDSHVCCDWGKFIRMQILLVTGKFTSLLGHYLPIQQCSRIKLIISIFWILNFCSKQGTKGTLWPPFFFSSLNQKNCKR